MRCCVAASIGPLVKLNVAGSTGRPFDGNAEGWLGAALVGATPVVGVAVVEVDAGSVVEAEVEAVVATEVET